MLCGDDNNKRLRGHEFVGENREISKSRSFHSQKEREKESPKWDSNTRPAAYEADALPTELLRRLFPFKRDTL